MNRSRLALLVLASCGSTIDRPAALRPVATAPAPASDAGAPHDASTAAAPPPADEAPLAWGTRPSKEGPLYAVLDGMCVHGEFWPVENATFFSYGNPIDGGYSRGGDTTWARFSDDGLERVTGFPWTPALLEGRWPGPLVVYSGFITGNRIGEPSGTVSLHDEQGWKHLASAYEKGGPDSGSGEKGRWFQKPVLFRGHVVYGETVRLSDTDSSKQQTVYRAVPPLPGIASLNHPGGDGVLVATDDAIYVRFYDGQTGTLREWRDGKVRTLGLGVGRVLSAKPVIFAGPDEKLVEIVDGKLVTTDLRLDANVRIMTVSAAPSGDLWISTSTRATVTIARRAADGKRTVEKEAIPAPAVARPPDENRYSAVSGGELAGVEHDDPYVIGKVGALFHREGDGWKEIPLPKPPWSTNRYRAQAIAMRQAGDLYVNAAYGEKGQGWKSPERYRAVLRTKRPRETLRCNEPRAGLQERSGRGFMSFPPLADDACTTPFVVILRTAYDIDTKEPHVYFDKKTEFTAVRESIKATPALGTTVDLVELASGTQRYLGAAAPSVAVARDFVTALAKRVTVLPELRPEIVCGTPPAAVRTLKVEVATGKIAP